MKIKNENQLQELALSIQDKELELADCEVELQRAMESLPAYKRMKDLQKQIENADKIIKQEGMRLLKELNLKTSEGPAGKITLCQKKIYTVVNEEQLPKEYKNLPIYEKEIKKLNKQIKNSFELFDNPVPGIQQITTEYIKITPKRLEEIDG